VFDWLIQKQGLGDLVINSPPADFVPPMFWELAGLGVLIVCVCYGLAKVIKAVKEWKR